jgi:hypothetical protein
MNRRTLPHVFAVFAVFLTAFGVGTSSSYAAGIDPEVVAQSIAEDGYYIDSGAKYLRTDTAQDQLRFQLERSKSPVFVAVLPAGTSLSPVQVYHLAKRKGTYAVLTGGTLRAASNTLSTARVNTAVSQAVRTHRGDPGAAVVAFVGLTNGTSKPVKTTRRTATPTPTTAAPSEPSAEPSDSSAPATAAGDHKDGGNGLLLGLVGALGVVLAGGVGYVVYRRSGGPKKSPV